MEDKWIIEELEKKRFIKAYNDAILNNRPIVFGTGEGICECCGKKYALEENTLCEDCI